MWIRNFPIIRRHLSDAKSLGLIALHLGRERCDLKTHGTVTVRRRIYPFDRRIRACNAGAIAGRYAFEVPLKALTVGVNYPCCISTGSLSIQAHSTGTLPSSTSASFLNALMDTSMSFGAQPTPNGIINK